MAVAIGKMGMDYNSFMELTPAEFTKIHQNWMDNQQQYFHLMQIAIYTGTGQAHGGKKFKSAFKKKKQTESKYISKEQREKEYAELKAKFDKLEGVK